MVIATITNMVCTYDMPQKSSNENANTFSFVGKHFTITSFKCFRKDSKHITYINTTYCLIQL